MTLDELIPMMARFFPAGKFPYFTFGGVGVSIWGEPRTTKDLDVVVCVPKKDIPRLVKGLNRLGFRVTRSLQRKLSDGRIVQLPIGRTRLDLKLGLEGHDRAALDRAKKARFDDFELLVAMPEDLILYKLKSWRTQDRADIENLLENVSDLEGSYIEGSLALLEKETGQPLRRRWKEVRSITR